MADALHDVEFDASDKGVVRKTKDPEGVATVAIEWDPAFETGNAAIDLQHKEILELVDDLEAAEADSDQPHEQILKVLTLVMDFTLSHFMMEEALMVEVDYPEPAQATMIEQHREFTSYARLRVLEFRKGDLVTVMPLQAFLAEWLIVHEFGLDRLLADFIREHADERVAHPQAE